MNADTLNPVDWDAMPTKDVVLTYTPQDAPKSAQMDFSSFGKAPPPSAMQTIQMHDAGGARGKLSLDREGFALLPFEDGVTDYEDMTQIDTIWRPAVEKFVKDLTGADAVVSWAYGMRFSKRNENWKRTPVSGPAAAVHSDFGPGQFCGTVNHEDANAAIEEAIGRPVPGRWKCFNIWQAISPAPYDTPLALCDASSVSADDICTSAGTMMRLDGKPGQRLEVCTFKHGQDHRWAYFPDMKQDELLIFTGMDPSDDDTWRVVPHTAFDDQDCPDGSVPRNSIELRVIAMWDV